MQTISLCMIIRDEEEVLARCLDSISDLVDEIIIVDTGSLNNTKAIAEIYTNHIYDFPWIDDFSAARNFAFSKATMDYCMWLDADDILTQTDRELFRKMKKSLDGSEDVIMMKYHVAFDEKNNPTFSYYRERILRRAAGFIWEGAVHEVIAPRGKILYSEAAVSHKKMRPGDPQRNIRIFEKLLADGKELNPRQQFYYGRELFYHERYQDSIAMLENFLNEKRGWLENNIEACMQLSACYEKIGDTEQRLCSLFKSFIFDTPRAEICCGIGNYFFELEEYKTAIFWYELAAACVKNETSGGFVMLDCYDYIPYIQLCVCYDKMGDLQSAERYNDKAGEVKPHDAAYLQNKEYFRKMRKRP